MNPNSGLLIVAILVLAIASGCKRDSQPNERTLGGAPHPPARAGGAEVTAIETPEPTPMPKAQTTPKPSEFAPVELTPAKLNAAAPPPVAAKATTTAPADPATVGQARAGLDELADNAKKLRHALLHADFRDPAEDDATPETNDKTKESDNDSR